ncbi:hypothetical protein A3A93_00095 [Candidatus Roizmanbacteria bacterium RIFCSPLOWO2_01_FULL_38_12]|uniref:Yip1 domain-containing protein n=1 Tax=Candidatus Roizmanbacteria bacterium RIFCSPLOWO2_01_FULL_38_12 TaxID=1802061 RepID=A0A1F7J0Q5_9BACT|nr:MAG: hypothetical protein A2861_04060 [Candidatus Roizmanbacteria bacterium RIFCSPHIGHO2_01_FULL_38_15]OGK34886.1 MAG: hypothetical protein A3F59_02725 [Candidatus Roizmanbacteria bacterium RIFCSPHIGHO2_12_FULL_38_13]OGK49152.1 MAG: hypothetical protein A3A93_00095 [Candidatus Roizmanbacteria bacterium RIFCSPLOWO2_01_FULL_38_12]
MMNMRTFQKILTFLFLLLLPTVIHAQTAVSAPQTPSVQIDNPKEILPLLGQNHYYTVTFRGNSEAIVTFRAAFSNFNDNPKSSVSFKVPKVTPKQITAFQIIREKRCIRFDEQFYNDPTRSKSLEKPRCLEYQEPNYFDSWWEGTTYNRAEVEIKGDTVNISLPNPINPNGSGSIILFYKSQDYVKRGFGGVYKYTFESLKSDEPISYLAVGINTDSDMKLKGASTGIDYFSPVISPLIDSLSVVKKTNIVSPDLDNLISQIGQGTIVKYSNYLGPLDSLTVSGAYASSLFALYSKEITIAVSIIIAILLIISFMILFFSKRSHDRTDADISEKTVSTNSHPSALTFVWILFLGFILASVMSAYTVLLYFLSRAVQNSPYYEFNSFLMLILTVVSSGVYAVILFLPTAVVALKKGYKWALITFAVMFFWIILYAFAGVVFVLSRLGSIYPYNSQPVPVPMPYIEYKQPESIEPTPALLPESEEVKTEQVVE